MREEVRKDDQVMAGTEQAGGGQTKLDMMFDLATTRYGGGRRSCLKPTTRLSLAILVTILWQKSGTT